MKKYKTTIILALLLVIFSCLSLFVGAIDIKLNELLNDNLYRNVFFASRIPRLMAILCTGMGMSISGLIMQKLCCNKFVSPTTGTTISGAQLGILISLILIPNAGIFHRSIIAFSFSLIATFIFVLFITRIKFKNSVMIPLIGIMMSNIILGLTNFIAFKYNATQTIGVYLTGSFAGIVSGKYEIVYLTFPLLILAIIFANHFNIAGMGEDFSKNLGINYRFILCIGLSICAMMSASIVVVVGSISYIGLIIPNIVSLFKGDKVKATIADTALLGALFVLICDLIGRIIIKPYELPIELIIGVIGSVLFIILIFYRMKNGNKSIRLKDKEFGI